jgi:nitrate reductase NapAB chaperone NapD
MAIAGLLVHTLRERVETVKDLISSMPEMTIFGTREGSYIVVVAEFASEHMERKVDEIKELDGVLTVYTTYVTTEDEFGDERP